MEGYSLKSKVARTMRLRQEGEYSAWNALRSPADCGFFLFLLLLCFSASCEARLLCGEVAFGSEEWGLTILWTDSRNAAAAAAARQGLGISTRQFACLIKSRMVTSPRAWLFTVTPPTSAKKWWHSNLRGNSGAQHFSLRRWNLTVAFHGVTMQRWGVEDPERRQRGSISSILVAWERLLSFDLLFQMSFQDRATNQLPTVVFNYRIILLLFINISSVFSSISQRSFSKK